MNGTYELYECIYPLRQKKFKSKQSINLAFSLSTEIS